MNCYWIQAIAAVEMKIHRAMSERNCLPCYDGDCHWQNETTEDRDREIVSSLTRSCDLVAVGERARHCTRDRLYQFHIDKPDKYFAWQAKAEDNLYEADGRRASSSQHHRP
jgi:hypothetical protein